MDILMPCGDTGVEECTLRRWLVNQGDHVQGSDDVAILELPGNRHFGLRLYERGMIAEILVQEGATVPVGTLLLRLVPEQQEHAHTHPQINLVERYMGEPLADDVSR